LPRRRLGKVDEASGGLLKEIQRTLSKNTEERSSVSSMGSNASAFEGLLCAILCLGG